MAFKLLMSALSWMPKELDLLKNNFVGQGINA